MKFSNYKFYGIILFIILLFIFYSSYNIEKYTKYPMGPKNNNVNVTFTPFSSASDKYTVCLYQVTSLDARKRKNLMKYGGCPTLGEKYTGLSGKYGWMIGLIKPTNLDTFDVTLTFDKNVTISDGEIERLITINNTNYRKYMTIQNNIVNIKIKTNEPQIMISLKYI